MALYSQVGGWDRVVAFTPAQVYWLHDKFIRGQAALRANEICDLSVVMGLGFSDANSTSGKAAKRHVEQLQLIAGFSTPNN